MQFLPDFLVDFLSRLALGDQGHDDVLGGHERKFLVNPLLDHSFIDDKAVRNVIELSFMSAASTNLRNDRQAYQNQTSISAKE